MKGLALTCLLAMLTSCNESPARSVVVVEKTKSYHREGCPKLNMPETTTMSIDSATARHLRPCPYCKPDRRK